MFTEKNFLKSKTVHGVIVAALPSLLGYLGIDISDHEGLSIEILTLVGSIYAIYGRFKASSKVKLR